MQSKALKYKQCADTRAVYNRVGGRSSRLARLGVTPVPTSRLLPPYSWVAGLLPSTNAASRAGFENAQTLQLGAHRVKCQTSWRDLANPPVQSYCQKNTNGFACACVGVLRKGKGMSPPCRHFLWIALPCLLLLGGGATSAPPRLIHLKYGSIRAHAHDNLCVCCSGVGCAVMRWRIEPAGTHGEARGEGPPDPSLPRAQD